MLTSALLMQVLNSLSSIGVAEAKESEVSIDIANSSAREAHESQLADKSSPLATLEREVWCPTLAV